MVRIVALAGSALLLACGGGTPPPAQDNHPDGQVRIVSALPPQTVLPAWGRVSGLASGDARKHGLLAAELDRDPTAQAIETALASEQAELRDRAALSLARIGGTAAAQYFIERLGEGADPPSSAMLGAIAVLVLPADAPGEPSEPQGIWATLESSLWTRYALTEDAEQAAALLLAIARIGGRTSIRNLAVDLAVLPDASTARRFELGAQAMAMLCVRRHALSADALSALGKGLEAEPSQARRGAAYALSRCAGPSAEHLAGPERGVLVERLSPMVGADEPGEALAAWRALESLGEAPSTVPESVLGADPPPWQVEVGAVRGLGASATGRVELSKRLAKVDPRDFDAPRVHVLLEALRALRPSVEGAPELLEPFGSLAAQIEAAMTRGSDPHFNKGLTLVRCELAALQAVRTGQLDAVKTCSRGAAGLPKSYGEVLAVDVLLTMGGALPSTKRADQLIAAVSSSDRAVAVAAVAGLASLEDPRVNPLLRKTMGGEDVGLVSAAAGAIASRAVDRSKRDGEAVAVLRTAIMRLKTDTAVEARVEAIAALGSLGRSAKPDKGDDKGDTDAPQVVPWLDDFIALGKDDNQAIRDAARLALSSWPEQVAAFDAAVPKSFPQGFSPAVHAALDGAAGVTGLRMHTAAGEITIDFAGAPAPIAQANLAALAETGYFDGLTFHRVVPAFVVQGGDPRGDGYGGPGHVLPCEWSNLRYERGTVGIALAGKDTGGSQIFISHGAPHHLDARYPIIGRVVEGLDVVDRLLPFDAIDSVDVLTR